MTFDWRWIPLFLASYAAGMTTWHIVQDLRMSDDNPPRCPRCGCYQWIYKGDKQVCADCYR
jgi:hypothetical protein